MPEHTEYLLHRLIGGDTEARTDILETAANSTSPTLLVAAALVCADPEPWLSRAAVHAATTRDRQLVAITVAHFGADEDLLDALVRDHLADYPDSLLVGWIAAQRAPSGAPAQDAISRRPTQHSPSRPPTQFALSRLPDPPTSGSHHV